MTPFESKHVMNIFWTKLQTELDFVCDVDNLKLFTVPMYIQNGIPLIHFSIRAVVLKHGYKFPGTPLIEK